MGFFSRFRRKKKIDDAAINDLAYNIAAMLNVQVAMAGDRNFDLATPQGTKALGYVYGFIDAALRFRGQDMADLSIGIPVTYQVLRKVFPGYEKKYLEFMLQSIQNDPNMRTGIMTGGQEYFDWINKKLNAPIGLGRYLIELRLDHHEKTEHRPNDQA